MARVAPPVCHATLLVSLRFFGAFVSRAELIAMQHIECSLRAYKSDSSPTTWTFIRFPRGVNPSTISTYSFYRSRFQVDASSALLLFYPGGAQPTTQTREFALTLIASKWLLFSCFPSWSQEIHSNKTKPSKSFPSNKSLTIPSIILPRESPLMPKLLYRATVSSSQSPTLHLKMNDDDYGRGACN